MIKWLRVTSGEYRSECGDYSTYKTYSRSGWICFDKTESGWRAYESTGRRAKDLLEGRALSRARQLDPKGV